MDHDDRDPAERGDDGAAQIPAVGADELRHLTSRALLTAKARADRAAARGRPGAEAVRDRIAAELDARRAARLARAGAPEIWSPRRAPRRRDPSAENRAPGAPRQLDFFAQSAPSLDARAGATAAAETGAPETGSAETWAAETWAAETGTGKTWAAESGATDSGATDSEAAWIGADEALRARWRTLVTRRLPEAAAARGWPIRLDHCFARVLLDLACGAPWRSRIRPPAWRNAPSAVLAEAVLLGEAALAGRADMAAMNAASLRLRGRA